MNLKDKEILRELAKHKIELHNEERNQQNIKDWLLHNTCRSERPMIHTDITGAWNEIFPKRFKCEDPFAKDIEMRLWLSFYSYDVFGDDYPVSGYFQIEWNTRFIAFGLEPKRTYPNTETGQAALGYKIDYLVEDFKRDFHKLGKSVFQLDKESTIKYAEDAADIIGDILPVKIEARSLYSVPTRDIVHIMGMETMFMAMYDEPELFHEMMRRFADDTIEYFRFLETNDVLNTTVGAEYLGQGSWCYTDELPSSGPVTAKSIWGFLDSQETVGVSPKMFDEMIFPYYKRIADQYGLLSYGCCEPVHPFWESSLCKFDNLRKITISPWCDEEYMGEALRGSKIIYHRKPSSDFLGVGTVLDEDAFRKHIRKTLKAAAGCTLEITQRDIYTINNDEPKARRYVEIIKEEINNNW